jgi:anti-sigma B factor antagonist
MAAMRACGPDGHGDDRFSMTLVVRGATVSMAIAGEVDVAVSERMRAVIGALTDVPGILHVDIDCREVTFVDSAGLRALLLARADAQLAGASWYFASSSPALRRLLDLAGAPELLADPAIN